MDWGTIIQVGATLVSSAMSSSASSSNASNVNTFAAANAYNTRLYGSQLASMTNMVANYNSKLLKAQGVNNAEGRYAVAEYNAELLQQIADYNSLLYQEEIDSVYEAAELDSELLHVASEKARGTVTANQAASGTVVGQDSNADVIVQMIADEKLEQLIIDTNADIQATSLMNASAQGQWQADMQSNKLLFEAKVGGTADILNSSMQANSVSLQGAMDAVSTITSAENRATEALSTAGQQSNVYSTQATGSLIGGALDSATIVASNWDSLME